MSLSAGPTDGHVQTGGPLHADVTTFLLARGADPLRQCNGIIVVVEAEKTGGDLTCTRLPVLVWTAT